MKITVSGVGTPHWDTDERMVAVRFHWNENQIERVDLTVDQAGELAEALHDYLAAREIEETLDRTVLAMTSLGVSPEVAAEVRQTVWDAMDNAS